jgi:hypothetical protein
MLRMMRDTERLTRLHPVAAWSVAAVALISCLLQWLFRAFEWGFQGGAASTDTVWQFYLPKFGLPTIVIAGLIGLQGGTLAGRTITLLASALMFLNAGLLCLLATTISERRDPFYPSWTEMHPRETSLFFIAIAAGLVIFAIRGGQTAKTP